MDTPIISSKQIDKKRPLYIKQNSGEGPMRTTDTDNISPPRQHSNNNNAATKMYEAVADDCVTIMSPGYAERSAYHHEEEHNTRIDDCANDSTPPEKPPRRYQARRHFLSKPESSDVQTCQKMKTGNGDSSCIDVDHINLESERNYKNKYVSIGVQTSPLVPYRLRFWPKGSSNVKCNPDESGCSKLQLKCCCHTFSRLCLSQIGLTIMLVFWALLGAAAFFYTEGPREQQQSEKLKILQTHLSVELATDLRLTEHNNQSWPEIIRPYLVKQERFLLEAISSGYGEGGGGQLWTYSGCVLFAISLLTTLGFGAPVPRTPLGRGATVLFAAIGIPLHFLLVLNIGNLTAIKLQLFVYRRCKTEVPLTSDSPTSQPTWLKWFPAIAIATYYTLGVILFGFARQRNAIDSFMFPLDFTAAGGVSQLPGYLRILYGLYLEFAVMLASLIVSLLQVSASRGIINLGLRLGLLTNR